MRELTQAEMQAKPWRLHWGGPALRPLHQWFHHLDLPRYGILIHHPIDWRNFVAVLVRHRPEMDVYGVPEHWPGSAEEVYRVIEHREDDCDGMAVLIGSGLYTCGFRLVHLAVGWYGDRPRGYANHAYCLHVSEYTGDVYLIDASFGEVRRSLPLLHASPQHHTLLSATPDGRYYAHGLWEEDW